MAYHDFSEMPVWQIGIEIVKNIYDLTIRLPKKEDYALSGQMRSASVSITGNIAEGFGRGHNKDKINFYFFARGSAFEVKSHLNCGEAVGYFTKEEILPICEKCNEIIESLNKIINGLRAKP